MQNAFFLGFLLLISAAFLWLLMGFWQPIFWAAAFAVFFHRVDERLEESFNGRASLAAFVTLMLILATVIIPAVLIGGALLDEAVNMYDRVQAGDLAIGTVIAWVETQLPAVDAFFGQFGIEISSLSDQLSGAAVAVSQFLASQALSIGQNTLRFTLMFFLMLYLLFFFLRDGPQLLEMLIRVLPIGDERERVILAKFAEVSRATLKGTLVIAAVQGTLGGFIFWALGIQSAVFWGVMMGILSLIPAVGPGLVWAPAALVLLVGGSWGKATILTAFGVLVIGLVDNLLRPLLVGRDTKMPDYLVLMSTLGGLTLFGISGFVVGPTIAALFLAMWAIFAQEFNEPESAPGLEPDAEEAAQAAGAE